MFREAFDIRRILSQFEIEAGVKITPEDTLIIFDEVQEIPRAGLDGKYAIILHRHAAKIFCVPFVTFIVYNNEWIKQLTQKTILFTGGTQLCGQEQI